MLARHTGQLYPVYVIRFKRHAADDFGSTEIEYLVVPTNQLPNNITKANTGGSSQFPMLTLWAARVAQF